MAANGKYVPLACNERITIPIPSKPNDPLFLHPSQQQVANDLMDAFNKLPNVLPQSEAEWKALKSVSCFFVGPAFVSLRDQTKVDLEAFQNYQSIKTLISSRFENKVNAREGRNKDEWLHSIRTADSQTLFILVHDEAHYGIKTNAELNVFFGEVFDAINSNPQTRLAVLLVSATLTVLSQISAAKPDFKELSSVVWNKKTVSGTYISVDDLRYVNDVEIGALKDKKNGATASATVLCQYIESWTLLQAGATPPANVADRADYLILKALKERKNLTLAGVRFRSDADAVALINSLRATASFEVVDPRDIDMDTFNPTKNTLIVMVDTVTMGIRIPATCAFWDVRCRYRKSSSAHLARFIQDVGRCAGHKKKQSEPATIFIGVSDWKLDIKKPHSLMTWTRNRYTLTNDHPEQQPGVYSALKDHIVLLLAEPQMGKTGVVLSFLYSIYKSHQHYRLVDPIPSLAARTRELYFIGKNQNFASFKEAMVSQFDDYHDGMDAANRSWGELASPALKTAQRLRAVIRTWTATRRRTPPADGNKENEPFVILDVGCGRQTLGVELARLLQAPVIPNLQNIFVTGIDIGGAPDSEQTVGPVRLFKRKQSWDEYASTRTSSVLADAVVFNLSLMSGDDIGEQLRLARKLLRPDTGILLITEMSHRFETRDGKDIKASIQALGFSLVDENLLQPASGVPFLTLEFMASEIPSSVQPPATVILNEAYQTPTDGHNTKVSNLPLLPAGAPPVAQHAPFPTLDNYGLPPLGAQPALIAPQHVALPPLGARPALGAPRALPVTRPKLGQLGGPLLPIPPTNHPSNDPVASSSNAKH